MDEKRTLIGWLRIGMAVFLGVLLVCLAAAWGKEQIMLLRLQWENEGRTWQAEGRKLADRLVEFVWNQKIEDRQPSAEAEKEWSLLAFFDSLNPWYRRKAGEEEPAEEWRELDPAYRDYLAARDFYIEHSYLAEEERAETANQGWASAESAEESAMDSQAAILEDSAAYAPSGAPGTVYSLAQLADYDFLIMSTLPLRQDGI